MRLVGSQSMIRKSGYRFSLATNAKAFARRSCSNQKIERDDDSKKSYLALDEARQSKLRTSRRHKEGGFGGEYTEAARFSLALAALNYN